VEKIFGASRTATVVSLVQSTGASGWAAGRRAGRSLVGDSLVGRGDKGGSQRR
jgi:hypothetical protein